MPQITKLIPGRHDMKICNFSEMMLDPLGGELSLLMHVMWKIIPGKDRPNAKHEGFAIIFKMMLHNP